MNLEEAQEYAQSVGAIHVLCSAKSGTGVDSAFLELTKGMLQSGSAVEEPTLSSGAGPSLATPQQGAGAGGRQTRAHIDISDDGGATEKTGCCS